MDDSIKRLEDKVDKIADKIASIDVTLAAQHESLKDHIRRTEILEEEIKPLKKHQYMSQGAVKFIGLVALIIGIVSAILKFTR